MIIHMDMCKTIKSAGKVFSAHYSVISEKRYDNIKMKIHFLTSIVLLAALQSAVEAIFLGPIAVGVALGAIAVKKGLILGSILSSGRTSHRNGRRYSSYSRTSHYRQSNDYYSHYTEPQVVSVFKL